MNKREFLKQTLLAGSGAILLSQVDSMAGNLAEGFTQIGDVPFPQPPLGYAYNALEPFIDAQTMEIHYSRHHAAYTKNFNAAVVENNLQTKSINEIFAGVSKLPVSIKNNGGGYYNHNLYWEIMAPNAGGEPGGELLQQIIKDFGSFAKFKEEFTKAAAGQFGSGWAWLIVNNSKLQIVNSANQDNPLMDIAPIKGIPILAIDVWEHAYYLKYQNKRAEYIGAFWNVIDWGKVGEKFAGIKK